MTFQETNLHLCPQCGDKLENALADNTNEVVNALDRLTQAVDALHRTVASYTATR